WPLRAIGRQPATSEKITPSVSAQWSSAAAQRPLPPIN
ncbi:hypothetical protein, partial [Pseudomonas sp. FEN]